MLPILTGREVWHWTCKQDYEDWLVNACRQIRSRPGGLLNAVDPTVIPPITHVSPERPARAYISCGRWVVACQNNDGRAHEAVPGFPFFCEYCGNYDIGHKWREVIFPPHAKQIEAILAQRGMRLHQNWSGESLEQVQAEQAAGRNV